MRSSAYGWRRRNGLPDWHPGVDYAAPIGTSIPAASGGTVYYSGYNDTYGNTVVIKSTGADGQNYFTLYAHMNGENMPRLGASVSQGDTIGHVGNTGVSDAAHLHFEVLKSTAKISNAAGGALGVRSRDQSIRYAPNTFDNWAAPNNWTTYVEGPQSLNNLIPNANSSYEFWQTSVPVGRDPGASPFGDTLQTDINRQYRSASQYSADSVALNEFSRLGTSGTDLTGPLNQQTAVINAAPVYNAFNPAYNGPSSQDLMQLYHPGLIPQMLDLGWFASASTPPPLPIH